jgi:hypothetical protein
MITENSPFRAIRAPKNTQSETELKPDYLIHLCPHNGKKIRIIFPKTGIFTKASIQQGHQIFVLPLERVY